MRFIVEVFRVLVVGLLALLLIGVAFVGFSLAMGGFAIEPEMTWPVAVGVVAAVIFALGLLATFIAIHDRLCEIAGHFGGAESDEHPLYPDGEP
jgi:hypothetical protein